MFSAQWFPAPQHFKIIPWSKQYTHTQPLRGMEWGCTLCMGQEHASSQDYCPCLPKYSDVTCIQKFQGSKQNLFPSLVNIENLV